MMGAACSQRPAIPQIVLYDMIVSRDLDLPVSEVVTVRHLTCRAQTDFYCKEMERENSKKSGHMKNRCS